MLTAAVLRAFFLMAGVIMAAPALAWVERWATRAPGAEGFRTRGPLVALAFVVKQLASRVSLPAGADRALHVLTPVVAAVPPFFALALMPLGPPVMTEHGPIPLDVATGQGTLALALGAWLLAPIVIVLAGAAGADRLALAGGLRLALVRLGAAVVVTLGCVGVAVARPAARLDDLVASQAVLLPLGVPALGVFANPLGFAATVFALAVLGQRGFRGRPDQNADLVEPYAASATGPLWLAHRAFELVDLLAASALVTTVFLGGALGPWVAVTITSGVDAPIAALGVFYFVSKTLLMAVLLLFVRRALPALQHDQAVRFTWTTLLPVALAGFALALVGLRVASL